jgi:methylmalonyl-CoA mutase
VATNYERWKALAEKELGGASFEDVLVHRTPDGQSIQPLYVEGPATIGPIGVSGALRVCMRVDPIGTRRPEALREDLIGGADALWIESGDDAALDEALEAALDVVVDIAKSTPTATLAWIADRETRLGDRRIMIGVDPVTAAARALAPIETLPDRLSKLAGLVSDAASKAPNARPLRVSTLQFHDSGAATVDELAIALSSGAAYMRALIEGGVEPDAAARSIALQVAIGRDTFTELCKLRALRVSWSKVLTAYGAMGTSPALIHAVCSSRTQSRRDAWTNMLRVSTQVFAAAIGGADYVTPLAYDDVAGVTPSSRGRRVARNTTLVLRDESGLGRVQDAAAGSYFFESFTDALARAAWERFQALEATGGIVAALANGSLFARIEASRQAREVRIATGKEPILGVTEFVNGAETLLTSTKGDSAGVRFVNHRDAEAFEEAK